METIKINNYITLNQGITPDEGKPLYEIIAKNLAGGNHVKLDFDGVSLLTTAFLNVAIGTLYKDYSSEQLNSMLDIVNIDNDMAARIKKVTTNAKAFYENQERFNEIVEEVLDGNM